MTAAVQPPLARSKSGRRLPLAMSLAEAVGIAGVLGQPSKLPGYSYGLDARKCRTGSKLRGKPGSVCSSCYALVNFYATWRPLLEGQRRRHVGLEHPRWVDAMVRMIAHYCQPPDDYFRWHDSGDLQSVEHLELIVEVCRRTPAVKHWLPTREYKDVATFLARGGAIPTNLVVRLSAHMIDTEPVVPPELAHLPTSTVQTMPSGRGVRLMEGKGAIECRAIELRDNRCGACRACWDARVTSVSYPEH